MDHVDNFISVNDTLYVLTEPRKKKLEWVDKKIKALPRDSTRKKVERRPRDRRKEEPSSKSIGYRLD